MSTEPIRVGRDVARAAGMLAPAASGKAFGHVDTCDVHQGAAGLRHAASLRGAARRAGPPPGIEATGESRGPALRRL